MAFIGNKFVSYTPACAIFNLQAQSLQAFIGNKFVSYTPACAISNLQAQSPGAVGLRAWCCKFDTTQLYNTKLYRLMTSLTSQPVFFSKRWDKRGGVLNGQGQLASFSQHLLECCQSQSDCSSHMRRSL